MDEQVTVFWGVQRCNTRREIHNVSFRDRFLPPDRFNFRFRFSHFLRQYSSIRQIYIRRGCTGNIVWGRPDTHYRWRFVSGSSVLENVSARFTANPTTGPPPEVHSHRPTRHETIK